MTGLYCKDLLHFSDVMSDSKRVMIVTELMSGRALSASFLSRRLNMSPQATRFHLKKLEDSDVISFRTCGKHHYYEIKNPQTADFIESVFHIIPPATSLLIENFSNRKKFEEARTCYRHLAGAWSVMLTRSLLKKEIIVAQENIFLPTLAGMKFLKNHGLLSEYSGGELLGKRCIDFSEHCDHIGGALGTSMLNAMMEQGWFQQRERCRELTITPTGYKNLNALIDRA